MNRRAITSTPGVTSSSRTPYRLLLTLLLASVVVAVGCTGKSEPIVTGKVTTGGQNVAGQIGFVDANGKEYSGPVSAGKYAVKNVPAGEYTVIVKGSGLGVA